MILSVHAVFGAGVASLVPTHPVAAFVLGFASHLALDAIPHRDYDLISVKSDQGKKLQLIDAVYRKFRLIRDVVLVSFDALVGLLLSFMFFFDPAYPWIFLLGAVGSLVPDFLTFLYLVLKHKPLSLFFDFHFLLIHSKVVLKLNQAAGVTLQFFTVAVLLVIIFGLKSFF